MSIVALMNNYGFSDAQAKAIVDMKLGKLAGLERIELEREGMELADQIEEYQQILWSERGC